MADPRKEKLHSLFGQITDGKGRVHNLDRAKLFLEAICAQSDPVRCVSRLISSSNGIPALKQALQLDGTKDFLNESVCALLQYLQAPQLEVVCNGDFLRRIIRDLTDPPIFWDGFLCALKMNVLTPESVHCFAWMLLQLVTQPEPDSKPNMKLAISEVIQQALQRSTLPKTRNLIQRIKHTVYTVTVPHAGQEEGPGGRHDNDFEDFRQIAILPTVDELASSDPPFMRFAREVDEAGGQSKLAMHLDNQFRLLREDMVRDLREDLQAALTPSKRQGRGQLIEGLRLIDMECNVGSRQNWALVFKCMNGLRVLPKGSHSKREQFLTDHRKVLANGSLACLLADGKLIGLSLIWRKDSCLAQDPPVLHVHLPDSKIAVRHILSGLRAAKDVKMVQLGTAAFAYQPILQQLQNIKLLPLAEKILQWSPGDPVLKTSQSDTTGLNNLVSQLESNSSIELASALSLQKSTKLDSCQARSLIAGLTQQVTIVQGPPGTGKSFIGALIGKAIYSLTDSKILVLSYTNHALDQYLEDLIDVGIRSDDIVRLGSAAKASDKTKPLVISEQKESRYNLGRGDWEFVNLRRNEARQIGSKFHESLGYYRVSATKADILEYLEFSPESDQYHEAFKVRSQKDGFGLVGKKGSVVDKIYLLDRWTRGYDAGVLQAQVTSSAASVWLLTHDERLSLLKRWHHDIFNERLQRISEYGLQYNKVIADVNVIFGEKDRCLMMDKRVIGCTTTAAAKYVKAIQSTRPDVIIVEEAGEILESHILTALGPDTKQLILIGDHKQLRPKAHYDLSVEKGVGYDLNRSLFERLVLKGYPHETLSKQHRMRPEISTLVRSLTYPELVDARSTENRPPMRGFQSNVVFVSHTIAEDDVSDVFDPREGGSTSSKNNQFEAEMTLKCVRYLAQQGYRSDQVVVLTPYLGQLRLLFDVLSSENDPVLDDMDTYDLVRAGLMPAATAHLQKRRLRVSTIDNYQGEESDIVVVSLTRSNPRNKIGFLSSPERLNVLLSRARDGLILIGNASMFLQAREGKELWSKFLGMLKHGLHIFEGYPVQCERHPKRQALITQSKDFDTICPDGGCDEPCQATLNCGLHKCPLKCHQLFDHSKMRCEQIMTDSCASGHTLSYPCFKSQSSVCPVCKRIKERDEKKKKADFERQQAEAAAKSKHEERVAPIDDEIKLLQKNSQQRQIADQRQKDYEQKIIDRENAKKLASNGRGQNPSTNQPDLAGETGSAMSQSQSHTLKNKEPTKSVELSPSRESPAEVRWRRKKETENESNDAVDELMMMTGLEQVKEQFLNIMDNVATAQRQNTTLNRLGVVLLGNPGTGKTTIARLYARFLVAVGVLPQSNFVETTGAKLANEGVDGTKKLLDGIVEGGGGAFFIDEAYQLTSGNNYGGGAVLDFLLAEIENTTGTVVFIFAGYQKQMEKFFQHNLGLDSRLPHRLHFADYSERELRLMLQRKIDKKWGTGNMAIEDGPEGLYMRIAVRRLHRQSGREGFGNARALENLLDKIARSQSSRLAHERGAGTKPDDFLLTKEDLIGPEPSEALENSVAWKSLQEMVGLDSVKQSVRNLLDRLQSNYGRELKELRPVEISLNRLFLGSPGTGKTTVARLYGKVLAEIGVLSSAECVMKTPADFIGSVIGESERNTKAILESTKGKVLVIDEAYMLHTSAGSGPNSMPDPFRAAIVDTIVSEVHSTPEDRSVLLLGYREQMEKMLQKTNPGMAGRFPIESAFIFEDYNDDQLLSILELKLKKQSLAAKPEAKKVAIDVLAIARRRRNFGNAGAVENLLSKAKESFSKRQQSLPSHKRSVDIMFEPQDFDKDFGRSKSAVENCREQFKDVVGCDSIVEKLVGYIQSTQNAIEWNLNPEDYIPFTFVFKGPPGTGKTTTARKIGRIFYDMGFLASDKVIECSATDLVAEYVGQTGPKVIEKLGEALGQVLFIDEAYRLGQGVFAKEAINELVDSLTKPEYKGKMIVVLAGYEKEINELLRVNAGLSSRFSEEIIFTNLSPEKCLELLIKKCQEVPKMKVSVGRDSQEASVIMNVLRELSLLPGWGNGRDIETISKRIISHILSTRTAAIGRLEVTYADILHQLERLRDERKARAKHRIGSSSSTVNTRLPTALAKPSVRHAAPPPPSEANTNAAARPMVRNQPPLPPSHTNPNAAARPMVRHQPPPPPPKTNTNAAARSSRKPPTPPPHSKAKTNAAARPMMQYQPPPPPPKTNPNAAARSSRQPPPPPPPLKANTNVAARGRPEERDPQPQRHIATTEVHRDPGVPDHLWHQLRHDIQQNGRLEAQTQAAITKSKAQRLSLYQEAQRLEKEVRISAAKAAEDGDEARRRHEAMRLQAVTAKCRADDEAERLRRLVEEAEKQRRREARMQERLRDLGVCCMGYRWIKQSDGYRCAGGSHFVGNEQLAM